MFVLSEMFTVLKGYEMVSSPAMIFSLICGLGDECVWRKMISL